MPLNEELLESSKVVISARQDHLRGITLTT